MREYFARYLMLALVLLLPLKACAGDRIQSQGAKDRIESQSEETLQKAYQALYNGITKLPKGSRLFTTVSLRILAINRFNETAREL